LRSGLPFIVPGGDRTGRWVDGRCQSSSWQPFQYVERHRGGETEELGAFNGEEQHQGGEMELGEFNGEEVEATRCSLRRREMEACQRARMQEEEDIREGNER
jgi:hypothetical protein